ncbi:RNA methyltransferase [Candidatus Woesebacteria bacterium]|nr:RNA methyltransferase [Candidatus Woesebacteria bacterium]
MQQKRLDRIKSVVQNRRDDIVVVLEDIHDPHNAAAILRTCDALGIQNIYFIFEKQQVFNPKKIGKASSSSANKWLTFTVYKSTQECIDALHKKNYTIIATALTSNAISLIEDKFTDKKVALMVGNEHAGLSETAISLADRVVMLPMKGFVQSLNVSVSAAVFLWDIVTKRKSSSFSTQEQKILLDDFIQRGTK